MLLLEGPMTESDPPSNQNDADDNYRQSGPGRYKDSINANTKRRGGHVLLLGYHEIPDTDSPSRIVSMITNEQ